MGRGSTARQATLETPGVCPQVISVPIVATPDGGGDSHAQASTGSAEHDDYRNEALSRALRPKGQAPRHRAAYYLVHNALLATMSFSLTTGWHGTAALLSLHLPPAQMTIKKENEGPSF